MAVHKRKQRLSLDAKQVSHLLTHCLNENIIIPSVNLRLQCAADKAAEKLVPLRCAPCKFGAAERTGNNGAFFNNWDNKSKAINRMRYIFTPISEVYNGGRGILNPLQVC